MTATKILSSEIEDLKVASLPSRPTAPSAFGGRGYTASEMKAAFDRLPLLLVNRFNALMDDIESAGASSLAAQIPTGITASHKLADLFADVLSGSFAGYLKVGNVSLLTFVSALDGELADLRRRTADLADALTVDADDEVFTSGDPVVFLHSRDYRAGSRQTLDFALPENPTDDFFCVLSFDSPTEPTTLTFPVTPSILFSGDNVTDGVFIPVANTHYTLMFWFDGRWEASVRGVGIA